MSTSVGYLRDVRAWSRFGFGSRGNLIIYEDCLVFAAVRRPLVNSVMNVRELVRQSRRVARLDSRARAQAALVPDDLVDRDRHNWIVRREDVAKARLSTSRSSEAGEGDDVVSLVVGAVGAVGSPTEHTLIVHLKGRKRPTYPSVKGAWGDAENELLKTVLGDRLQ